MASVAGKIRKKTNVFWSTVPENEQFRNVRVPGVALEALKSDEMNLKRQAQTQIVRKSKSDPGVTSKTNDPSTSGKSIRITRKNTERRKESLSNSKDVLRDVSNGRPDSVASLSGSDSRRASIKNLNIEDKKRVANLIKELAKTGEERELALERLQEERVSFEERLRAVQEEQASLRLEKEALRQKLNHGEEQLKKYEKELQRVKQQKENQGLMLRKRSAASAQATQTSPLQKLTSDSSFSTDGGSTHINKRVASDGEASQTNKRTVHNTKYPLETRIPSGVPPVYSNSLFDLKMSKAEQPVQSGNSPVHSVSDVGEGAYLHELYLREYKLQLQLQEQQIEIQRQQVLLQQHLQLLQQQQQQQQQQSLHQKHGKSKGQQTSTEEIPTQAKQMVYQSNLMHKAEQAHFVHNGQNEVRHNQAHLYPKSQFHYKQHQVPATSHGHLEESARSDAYSGHCETLENGQSLTNHRSPTHRVATQGSGHPETLENGQYYIDHRSPTHGVTTQGSGHPETLKNGQYYTDHRSPTHSYHVHRDLQPLDDRVIPPRYYSSQRSVPQEQSGTTGYNPEVMYHQSQQHNQRHHAEQNSESAQHLSQKSSVVQHSGGWHLHSPQHDHNYKQNFSREEFHPLPDKRNQSEQAHGPPVSYNRPSKQASLHLNQYNHFSDQLGPREAHDQLHKAYEPNHSLHYAMHDREDLHSDNQFHEALNQPHPGNCRRCLEENRVFPERHPTHEEYHLTKQLRSSTNQHILNTEQPDIVERNHSTVIKHDHSSNFHHSNSEHGQSHLEVPIHHHNGRPLTKEQPFIPVEQHPYQKGNGVHTVSTNSDNLKQSSKHLRNDNSSNHSTGVYRSPTKLHGDYGHHQSQQQPMNNAYTEVQAPLDRYISNHPNYGKDKPVHSHEPVYHVKNNHGNHYSVASERRVPLLGYGGPRKLVGGRPSRDNGPGYEFVSEDENLHPGYLLYNPEASQRSHSILQSPVPVPRHPHHVQSPSQNYPNSLIQFVEHLESTNDYSESISGDLSTSQRASLLIASDEEESAVLDNIFFLRR